MNDHRKLHPTLRAAAVAGLTGALAFSLAGCKHDQTANAATNGQDPADANLAQPYTGGTQGQTQVLGQSDSYTPQSSGENYETQAPAPIIRQAPAGAAVNNTQYYPVPQAQSGQNGYAADANYQGYTDAEEAGEQALAETDQAPPPLPEYDQPPAPADNYIWTPGYWNYANTGYYWVPGVWCAPPFYGALWTPPYWGYYNNHYMFHRGYWGPHVGYYGGINYGFGYIGFGYFGGYWNNHSFFYNRAVTNVNVNVVHNVYMHTVVYNNHTYGPHPDNRVDYVGGRGGLNVQPRPQEIAAMREAHYAPLPAQREVRLAAASNRSQFYNVNHGNPAQSFAARPVGTVNNIASAPREQAFNHPGAPIQPGFAARPGTPSQPAFAGRPGEPNRAAQPNQPAFNGRPGEPNRPGTPNQPAFAGRPGELNRPGTPNQPAFNGRPGELNRPGTPNQPAFNGRPGEPNRAAQPGQPAVNANRPGGEFNRGAQPAYNNNRPTAAPAQPAENNVRPGGFNRETQPNQPRPNVEAQRPPQAQPQPQARPNFQQARPAQPQPNFQRAPQPEARPQQSAPRPAAPAARPAPAPRSAPPAHGGEGGDHKH